MMSVLELEIDRLKNELQLDTHFLVSSKTGDNINEVLDKITREMVK